jgi:hypothetical protein
LYGHNKLGWKRSSARLLLAQALSKSSAAGIFLSLR